MRIYFSELFLNLMEEAQQKVWGDVEELHIYNASYGNFTIVKDGKKLCVTVNIEEENKDA